jgi:hypothetical protein
MRSRVLLVSLAVAAGTTEPVAGQTLFPWYNRHVPARNVYATAFASGDVRTTGGNANDPVAANGSVGLSLQMRRLTVAGFVNVVTTVDSVEGNFGPALLTPAVGGRFRAGVMELRFANIYHDYGIHAYSTVSNAIWALPVDTARSDTFHTRAFSASVVGAGVTAFRQWEAFSDTVPGNERNGVAFGLEGGLAWRRLSGDIATQTEFRQRLLGTDARSYLGLEAGMTITINNMAAGIQLYRMWSLKGATLNGLTGTQISTGLSLQGKLFSFLSPLN